MNTRQRILLEGVTLFGLAGLFAHLNLSRASDPLQQQGVWANDYQNFLGSPMLTVRTFQAGNGAGDHPDFRRTATSGPGRYADILAPAIGGDGAPAFNSTGHKVTAEWKDSAARNISRPRPFIRPAAGDIPGTAVTTPGDAAESRASVAQWFRDVPGINTSTRANLDFTRTGSKFEYQGSLDNITGRPNFDYTASLDYYFINEPGRDWYFLAESDAEVWVYIDGKLVIDGGGLRGVDFRIENGAVVTTAPCEASLTVVGAAIQSGSTPCPVTMQASAGGFVYEPFGAFGNPILANLNTAVGNPRNATLASVAAGTAITVSGRSFLPGAASAYMTEHSNPATRQVKVLRDGDVVPDIRPFANQTAARDFLAPYVDAATDRVTLQPNQAIFLFELGTNNLTSPAADFQDLVVVLTLSRPGSELETPGSTVSTRTAAPTLSQRIDLNRLAWLEDRGSYKMQIFFANRTGGPSNLRFDTNIATLNLANRRIWPGAD